MQHLPTTREYQVIPRFKRHNTNVVAVVSPEGRITLVKDNPASPGGSATFKPPLEEYRLPRFVVNAALANLKRR